jgi:transposase
VPRSNDPADWDKRLNPIEQVLSKFKTLLRKADVRSIEATWRQIGAFLDRFTSEQCANYLTNAGYASA